MLTELYVRNLAVIEELRLEFEPGLTVLTGDKGVGKSLVVDALGLLLGGPNDVPVKRQRGKEVAGKTAFSKRSSARES